MWPQFNTIKYLYLIHIIKVLLNVISCTAIYSFQKKKKFTNLLYRWNEIQDLWDCYIHLSQFGVSTALLAVGWRTLQLSTWRMAECVQPTCNASSVRSTTKQDNVFKMHYPFYSSWQKPQTSHVMNIKLDHLLIWQWNSVVTNHPGLAISINRMAMRRMGNDYNIKFKSWV